MLDKFTRETLWKSEAARTEILFAVTTQAPKCSECGRRMDAIMRGGPLTDMDTPVFYICLEIGCIQRRAIEVTWDDIEKSLRRQPA